MRKNKIILFTYYVFNRPLNLQLLVINVKNT